MSSHISEIGENVLIDTDSYKVTHWKQYPPHTRQIYSYFESRGGAFPEVLFFGLQYSMKRYLEGQVVTAEKIDEMEEISKLHFSEDKQFNRTGWEYILKEHGGRLPVSIRAVPEGTMVPTRNVIMTIENTDPNCYWLTNYLETMLVRDWYPSTVATLSMNMKKALLNYLDETGTPELVDFKLHDFGSRGSTTAESAAIGGAAHLVNFKGTDTLVAVQLHRKYYHEKMAGFSIPAAEHSTITAWGRENEADAMRNMLEQFPKGFVAVVSDSFNIFEACRSIWGEKLKEQVLGREGTLVIRPDSGDAPKVVVEVLNILGEKFGYTLNSKGYRVLDPHVRVIQGDGIKYFDGSMVKILENMKQNGWSADNIAFGSGGGLIQNVDRDTAKFAFKCSSANVNGVERDVYKQPVTDPGKNSKAGKLKLVYRNGNFETLSQKAEGEDQLVEVFRDGKVLKEYALTEIRERAAAGLQEIRRTEQAKKIVCPA